MAVTTSGSVVGTDSSKLITRLDQVIGQLLNGAVALTSDLTLLVDTEDDTLVSLHEGTTSLSLLDVDGSFVTSENHVLVSTVLGFRSQPATGGTKSTEARIVESINHGLNGIGGDIREFRAASPQAAV
jgi:hypothetical protein